MHRDSERATAASGVPPFHVHPGHLFEGFELIERAHTGEPPVLLARCSCGEVLDTAPARFAPCPACRGGARDCMRCGATGRVVDHAALEWTAR
jgi:hypothetical protein